MRSGLFGALLLVLMMSGLDVHAVPAGRHPTEAYWRDVQAPPVVQSSRGTGPTGRFRKYRPVTLDRLSMRSAAAAAPRERTADARLNPLVIALPHPDGGFQRFALTESPVMEPALAARHPEIKTYAGQGLDDKTASIRMDITPLGLHASVRAANGPWYIDPYDRLDDSVYASYRARDVLDVHGPRSESDLAGPQIGLSRGTYHAGDTVQLRGAGFAPNAPVVVTVRNPALDAGAGQTLHLTASADGALDTSFVADPYKRSGSYHITAVASDKAASTTYLVVADAEKLNAQTGQRLRTYRLALLTDPSYAAYFGGPANVTAAKVTLVNRVSQIYESETSIRLMLVAGNDALNLDTAAQMTGVNGPCGGAACFTQEQALNCSSSTLDRTRQVIGLLVGGRHYDIGHLALGSSGGGLATLGVVGTDRKAQGCTGLPTPVGDYFAVDYVAHEIGHQFGANHTFNGTTSSCSGGNRNPGTSVEPGSGSSIMAYAGICGADDLQPHADPYWSGRSFEEIVTYTSAAESVANEVQVAALTRFDTDGQKLQLRYGGADSVPIVRGTNYTAGGIKAAIEGIAGWPTGGQVTVSAGSDKAFTVTFGGTLAGMATEPLQVVNCSGGCAGFVGEVTQGGPTTRGGTVVPTDNKALVVTTAPGYTIPVRTPFALTGAATGGAGDTVTYMWEQNDRGAATGTSLLSNAKLNGPLFRQFGTRAVVDADDALLYDSPGHNVVGVQPTRVFPDMAKVLADNTNAKTGACPAASAEPTAAEIDCYSEFLPTAAYVGLAGVNANPPALHFRLTARDGQGGVGSADTTLSLATGAGPFRVTWPTTGAAQLQAGSTQTVTWSVAGTNVAPVGVANVRISLSTDGGRTWPHVLATSAANNGRAQVALPSVRTSQARIKVEAVGNVFFDVSHVDFAIAVPR